MTTLYDSVTGDACPLNAAMVAGYVDGPYGPNDPYGSGWTAAAWARYPNAIHVTITVEGSPGALVADCETGTGLYPPYKAAAWAKSEIAAGRRPTIYASLYDWSEAADNVDRALAAIGLERGRDVDGWVADVNGGQQTIPPGFVARQYAQGVDVGTGHNCDISWTNGVWPGKPVPPAPPVPTPTPAPEDIFAMLASDPGFAVRFLYRICLHREADEAGFTANVNYLNGGGSLNQVMANLQDSAEGKAVLAGTLRPGV